MIGPGEQQGAVPGGSESAPVDMRIGDTERNLVVERLQSALGEGRLDITEFDERLAAVYAARTVSDLQPLTADLPAATTTAPAPVSVDKAAAPRRDRQRQRHGDFHARNGPGRGGHGDVHGRSGGSDGWLFWAWRAWATAVAVNLVIWLAVSLTSDDLKYFWPMWVAGPWGAVLLVNTVLRPRH